jgi:hypothetical protein
MKKIYTFFFCVLIFAPFVMKAQTPASEKTLGEWEFDKAIVQEKLLNNPGYNELTLYLEQFILKPYSWNIPTEMGFAENRFLTATTANKEFMKVFSCLAEEDELIYYDARDSQIYFHDEEDPEYMKIESYPLLIHFTNLIINPNSMSMQFHYFSNDLSPIEEAVVILYYKRKP